MIRNSLVIVLLIAACLPLLLHSFQFDIDARTYKCFREELPTNFDVYGEYSAYTAHGQIIDLRITDPSGRVVVDRKDINIGDFNFIAKDGGEYSFCFFNRVAPGTNFYAGMSRRVFFDVLTGTETFDYEGLAKKEHMRPIEVNLKMMEDIVKQVYNEYSYLRSRENDMRRVSDSIYSRVALLNTLCVVFGIIFAFVQVSYLRSFFIRKKLV